MQKNLYFRDIFIYFSFLTKKINDGERGKKFYLEHHLG